MAQGIGQLDAFFTHAAPPRTRFALVLALSAVLHVALLSRLPHTPIPMPPTVLDVALEADRAPPRRRPAARMKPADDVPRSPKNAGESNQPLRSLFETIPDDLRTEVERARRGAALGSAPLPELPSLGDDRRRSEGLVRSYRLASGGMRYEYQDRNGKTSVWECPEPNPNESFALNLCRTGY